MIIFGHDPGANGALAVLRDGELLVVEDLPTHRITTGRSARTVIDEMLLADQVSRLADTWVGPMDDVLFACEQVQSMPRDGAVQSFAFGLAFGLMRGVMAPRNYRTVFVRPPEWKKALKLKADKDASRQRAIQLWPTHSDQFSRKCDDGRAEAALIGYWAATCSP